MDDVIRRIFSTPESTDGDVLPSTVDDIFKDFSGRRSDFDRLYSLCDPDKENLCLYGFENGTWEVNLPPEVSPPNLPQPMLGINYARDGMRREDWLALIAANSDSWLISLSFFFSAHLSHHERSRLFGLINDLPTLFEVVTPPKRPCRRLAGNRTN